MEVPGHCPLGMPRKTRRQCEEENLAALGTEEDEATKGDSWKHIINCLTIQVIMGKHDKQNYYDERICQDRGVSIFPCFNIPFLQINFLLANSLSSTKPLCLFVSLDMWSLSK